MSRISASKYEDFRYPKPQLPEILEKLEARPLAQNKTFLLACSEFLLPQLQGEGV